MKTVIKAIFFLPIMIGIFAATLTIWFIEDDDSFASIFKESWEVVYG